MTDPFAFQTLLSAAAVLLAGLIRGFAGFGSAMVMTPVLAALWTPAAAVPVTLLLELLVSAPLLPRAAPLVDWRRIGLLTAAAILAAPLGIWLLVGIDPGAMRWVISAIVLIAVAVLASGWRYSRRPGSGATLAAGGLSGVLNGLSGMGGPPIAFYYLSGPDGASAQRASFIVYFALVDAATVALFAAQGAFDGQALLRTAMLLPFLLLGAWIGARLFHRGGERAYRVVAFAVLVLIAIGSLVL